MNRNPCWSRFSGRTCDPVEGPTLEQSVPEGLHPWKEPMLEQFVKNCSPWERLMVEKFVEDCLPREGSHVGAGEEYEEEGVVETMNERPWRPGGEVWSKEDVPLVEKDQIREYLSKLVIDKSMGPDGVHPQVLRELSDVTARPLLISSNNHDYWEKCKRTPRKQISPLSSKRAYEGQGDKRKSCLTNLINFYDEMTGLVDERREQWILSTLIS
ncbi:hypothetical protein QYF61_006073, partial [Mycteria americana]